MQFDVLAKKCYETTHTLFKIVTNAQQYKKTTEDEKFIF